MRAFTVFVVFALSALCAQAAVYNGALQTSDQWHYISKFCFSNEFDHTGTAKFVIETSNKQLQLAVYIGQELGDASDRLDSWQANYAHKPGSSDPWSCQTLVKNAKGVRSVTSGVPVQFDVVQKSRAFFWYFAVADCSGNSSGIDISSYSITFLNPGGHWDAQFSYDEQGIGQTYIAFFVFYVILLGLHAFGVFQQMRTESWHPIIRVLGLTILLCTLSSLAEMIHYSIYANDGIGAPGLLGVGELLNMLAEVVFMFLCILIAKGWAITTSYLGEKNIILIVNALLILAYLALFIWARVGTDPADVMYFYDSIPGAIVLTIRVGVLGWYLWCLRNTIRLESLPDKRNFYFIFGGAYAAWFLALPVVVLIAFFLSPTIQFRLIEGLSVAIDFVAVASLAFILWPSRAHKYFVIKASPQLLSVKEGGYGTTSTAHEAVNSL